jgi:hypothetical protein
VQVESSVFCGYKCASFVCVIFVRPIIEHAPTVVVNSTWSASKVESHAARIHLLFSHFVHTPIPWGIIHFLPSIRPSILTTTPYAKTHAEIHKAANWYICVCAEGESFRNRNTCTETQTKSQNKTRNYAVRSSRAGLLDIRQYKMGIILFVVAMSRPDTNASLGIVRKTGTNSSSSKWCII